MNEVHPAGRGWKTVAPGLESVMSKYQHPPTGRTKPCVSALLSPIRHDPTHLGAVALAGDDDDIHALSRRHPVDAAVSIAPCL